MIQRARASHVTPLTMEGRQTCGIMLRYVRGSTSTTTESTFIPLPSTLEVMSIRESGSAAMDASSERAPLLQTSAVQRRRSYPTLPGRLLLPRTVVRALLALLVLLTAALLTAIIVQEYKDRQNPRWGKGRNYTPVLARGKHGAVAAESERCSQIGVDGE